jgi:hypothetical protein
VSEKPAEYLLLKYAKEQEQHTTLMKMKKTLLTALLLLGSLTYVYGQNVYNEGMKMAKEAADDESSPLDARKIATFKYDAIQYLGVMSSKFMPDSSAVMLDRQTLALYNYVNLFTKHYAHAEKKDKETVIQLFSAVSLRNPRFKKKDEDKEWALAYIATEGFITKFSLNTDWEKAYEDVTSLLKHP